MALKKQFGKTGLGELAQAKVALNAAIRKNNTAEVAKILQKNKTAARWRLKGSTALHEAVRAGAFDVAKQLLKAGARTEDLDDGQKTPLMLAAAQNKTAMMNLLFAHNAALDGHKKSRYTALIIAASICDDRSYDAVKLLLDKGASVHIADPQSGDTALHAAATENNPKCVAEILKHNPDLEKRNAEGLTPFMCTGRYCAPDAAPLLLSAGANPDALETVRLDDIDDNGNKIEDGPQDAAGLADIFFGRDNPGFVDEFNKLVDRERTSRQIIRAMDAGTRAAVPVNSKLTLKKKPQKPRPE